MHQIQNTTKQLILDFGFPLYKVQYAVRGSKYRQGGKCHLLSGIYNPNK